MTLDLQRRLKLNETESVEASSVPNTLDNVLDYKPVRAGGLCLCSSDFNRLLKRGYCHRIWVL